MNYTEIMVRYGELSTKGKNRNLFIQQLTQNVRKVLVDFPELRIQGQRDRMHILLNGADAQVVIDRLRKVFGIQNFSPVVGVAKEWSEISAAAIEIVKANCQTKTTFKVTTKRADHSFEMDTNELNQRIGAVVQEKLPQLQVQLKKPDIDLRVEIRQNQAYLSCETIQGAGGLPVGTGGRGMLMLSGGIDSPVAGYLAMKRGLEIEAVHFCSPPYTSEQALQKAKELTVKLAAYNGSVQFIAVPFTEIQEEIKKRVPSGYLMTVTRRMMLRLTDLIRVQREGLAIINGESIGQVASQTLQSMLAINDVTTTPIIRPVVTLDKLEIIALAEEIDTYNLAIQPFEDCCTIFAPPQPKTKPKLDKAREYEARMDIDDLIKRALAGIEVTEIRHDQAYLHQVDQDFADLL